MVGSPRAGFKGRFRWVRLPGFGPGGECRRQAAPDRPRNPLTGDYPSCPPWLSAWRKRTRPKTREGSEQEREKVTESEGSESALLAWCAPLAAR